MDSGFHNGKSGTEPYRDPKRIGWNGLPDLYREEAWKARSESQGQHDAGRTAGIGSDLDILHR